MSEEVSNEIYVIDFQYTDSGLQMVYDMQDWYSKIERDFASFEALKDFYRTKPETRRENFVEHSKEVESEEDKQGGGIVMKNPPQDWIDNPEKAAQFLEIGHRTLVSMGVSILIEEEIDAEREMADDGLFKPLVVRQSAFYEEFLTLRTMLAFQGQKEDTLSTKELKIIESMGHTDRIRISHLMGILDEDEHGLLQNMASWRNRIAHNPWSDFNSQDESQIQSIAEGVLDLLENELASPAEDQELTDINQSQQDFDIGFGGLDPSLQNLQLGILDVLRATGGDSTLRKIKQILPQANPEIERRAKLMDHIGYIEVEDEKVSLLPKGEGLLDTELSDLD
ncbi:hypothetical protein [Haloarchaeobius sp. TZWSO28]|uniref:hypothetical protein n=1 Tax=Haloarchaeobius sp. TZWSO28 TaxID=3446119 RepID=UPI003EBEC4EB